MSKPINHTLIGAFVLGALALIVGSIIAFSSFTFNKRTYPFIVYVTDSLNGLSINSDVKFKGVKIGQVKKILLHFQDNPQITRSIPVIIEINESTLRETQDFSDETVQARVKKNVAEGLRARIQQANLLTGMLYIELDYFPETPIIYRGGNQTEYIEIPTIPSNMSQMLGSVAQILENLSQIDFKSFSEQLKATANNLNASVSAIEFEKINENILQASAAARKILTNPQLSEILENANRITQNTAKLSEKIETNFDPLQDDFRKMAAELRLTLDQVSQTMFTLQTSLGGVRGSVGQEFGDALKQLDEAARSVRELSDYIREHPSDLFWGADKQP